jgi:lipoprotein-releasing system permease protein
VDAINREAEKISSGQRATAQLAQGDGLIDDDATADEQNAGPLLGNVLPPELGGGKDAAVAAIFDPANEQYPGIILGISTCSNKLRDEAGNVRDHYYCRPGDDVRMMFPSASENPKVLNQKFTVVDLYESGMSEYDSTFAFVRLDKLQDFRGMINPATGVKSVTTIQLKLAEGADLNAARDALRKRFPPDIYAYSIQTWRDMQGPLLAAVRLETTILNILLFLIIAVAGFGILATFFMIVVEKTRDIGTLKSLGASGSGVMSIFLSYGLLLGIVGSGVGLLGGILFVQNINEVAGVIEKITGQEVFDPTVYYFTEIPTILNPFTLAWVMAGAVAIATTASVLPAMRAARMHPVTALRFE